MVKLPEPGDAREAFNKMDERAHAAVRNRTDHVHDAGTLAMNPATGAFGGDALDAFRFVYGDLFVMEEVLAEGGLSIIRHAMRVGEQGDDELVSAVFSLALQFCAVGVLMERARWTA